FLDAIDEDAVLCASPIISIPGSPDFEPNTLPPMGLFRMSSKEITRIGTDNVAWVAASPDRKHFAAFASDGNTDAEKAKWRLLLLDDKGATVRVLKELDA